MNKFSIVIPTMWRYMPFVNFIHRLAEQEYCGEIIIINNDNTRTPIIRNSKIRLLDYGKNIGVNPAWNLGVYASKHDNICILNDDVEFDFAVFEHVNPLLKKGMFIVNSLWSLNDTRTNPEKINIKLFEPTDQLFHYGSMMFITKSDWIHIPNELVIFFGDNWIWHQMQTRYNNNHVIWNLTVYTPGSVTCNSFSDKHDILENESVIFSEKILDLDKFLKLKLY